ncbi:MAG: DUF4278 domain-containing protein [Synechococcus sp. SB0662_bin_45]|uniref:DUF4278 domain-containing protein n=1 Tax=Synechococcus sp. SB0676_bin_10 TaxID=2604869 RepID=A0A6B1F9R1_9SYNE|nr:DUF4278 domain-containing protein [Cyanobacteria bacterium MAG IRC3_bin_20]MCY3654133.1 DUF4278 domain-containing protein [Cyanobacteria bacterium MAG IRC1_bin_28]MDE0646819.1 DUF4278 domain-containing protein [Cyanobacteria bacterium MAG IRC4_bin_6]MXW12630.1 DUF4278 domain-containing protein [Synechococcus sp. SB0668_bin_13]MXX08305.1 DUF4278 domain-containing protein [Synechococcus sp. SB0667_bin_8]MXY19048.1 DUF4278 domain-containing protein [Synechococcus sp. SB0664_bin_36]MYE21312.1 
MVQLKYRGVDYDTTQRPDLSDQPVEHVYRGIHFNRAPRHEADALSDQPVRVSYRGAVYETRIAEALKR